ncbi:MAG: serine hydrolase [Gemmatimonadaceae bacterium]|nr:serine hydrolase [Gemmatimonadaceae bacterium]
MLLPLLALLLVSDPAPTGAEGRRVARRGEGLPDAKPSAVGMAAHRLEAIDRVVQRGIKSGGYPGAAVVVGRRGYSVFARGYGRLSWDDASAEVSPAHTIYDLASVSKVVGTTAAAMALFDEGRLKLDAPVMEYLPAFADGGAKNRVTVRMLLTHRSGLPAGRDLWRIALSPGEARQALLNTPIRCEPGDCFVYSDLGMDVLGLVLEEAAGESLDSYLARRVFGPLGMTDTWYRPPAELRYRIAPTELTPPRGYPLRGEVHDENAYILGGVAGHAGLFSTAADLSVFAQAMLNGGTFGGARVFADSTVKLFTARSAGERGLGWDTCAGKHGCGDFLGPTAYGHIGYTGTSVWIDPEREMFVILLTNRVHAARARRPAKVIADIRDDLADAAAWAVVDEPEIAVQQVAFRADSRAGWNRPVRVKKAKSRRPSRGKASSASTRSKSASTARKSTAKKTKSSAKPTKKKATTAKAKSATKKRPKSKS